MEVLVRDEFGQWLEGFYAGKRGDPLQVEIEALKLRIEMLWNMNTKKAYCEHGLLGDC